MSLLSGKIKTTPGSEVEGNATNTALSHSRYPIDSGLGHSYIQISDEPIEYYRERAVLSSLLDTTVSRLRIVSFLRPGWGGS